MLTRATVWLLFDEELSLSGTRYYHFECLNHHTGMVRARSNAFKRRVNESRVYTSRLKSINMIPVGLLRHSNEVMNEVSLNCGVIFGYIGYHNDVNIYPNDANNEIISGA